MKVLIDSSQMRDNDLLEYLSEHLSEQYRIGEQVKDVRHMHQEFECSV